jgi:tripartite-type tricarboxylate transporter receptor subunit TctC
MRAMCAMTSVALTSLVAAAVVQDRAPGAAFPGHVVRIIVPSGPGGPPDLRSRQMASKLATEWAQPVIVENRPGAGGQLAMDLILQSPADGHAIAFNGLGTFVIAPHLRKMPFELKDFVPITLTGSSPLILVVTAGLPVNNLADLIGYARRNPGKLNAASAGVGTMQHLALEVFKRATGVVITHVPYKDGAGQTITDLTSGQVDMTFETFTTVGPHVASGRLRALAVAGRERMQVLPEVATFNEHRLPAMESLSVWGGLFARAGTPRPIIDKLHRSLTGVLKQPDVRAYLIETGAQPATSTPEEFVAFIRAESIRYARLINEAGIKIE